MCLSELFLERCTAGGLWGLMLLRGAQAEPVSFCVRLGGLTLSQKGKLLCRVR